MNIFTKTKSYLKRYGALNLLRKVTEKASRGFDISEEFVCENLTDEELLKQRNYKFLHSPVISIIISVNKFIFPLVLYIFCLRIKASAVTVFAIPASCA